MFLVWEVDAPSFFSVIRHRSFVHTAVWKRLFAPGVYSFVHPAPGNPMDKIFEQKVWIFSILFCKYVLE